jgi:hypothetical protein
MRLRSHSVIRPESLSLEALLQARESSLRV